MKSLENQLQEKNKEISSLLSQVDSLNKYMKERADIAFQSYQEQNSELNQLQNKV